MNRHALFAVSLCALAACTDDAVPPSTSSHADPPATAVPLDGAFVGRVWVSTQPGRPLGSMIVFLPNKSLIMDSCFETYRISEWGVAGNNIRWREDTMAIEAEVTMPGPDELTLKIAGQDQQQTYLAASVPYVCPDMVR